MLITDLSCGLTKGRLGVVKRFIPMAGEERDLVQKGELPASAMRRHDYADLMKQSAKQLGRNELYPDYTLPVVSFPTEGGGSMDVVIPYCCFSIDTPVQGEVFVWTLPLRLGYASTVHKAIGVKIDKISVFLDDSHRTIAANGLTCTALGCVRSLSDVTFEGDVSENSLTAHRAVIDFFETTYEEYKKRCADDLASGVKHYKIEPDPTADDKDDDALPYYYGDEEPNLNEGQRNVAHKALAGYSLYIGGSGGTGKSYTINLVIKMMERDGKRAVILAPTGIAAYHIGGRTIDSFLGMRIEDTGDPKKDIWELAQSRCKSEEARATFCDFDVLVLDEISMVHPRKFQILHAVIGWARRRPDLPFRGVQLLTLGDFGQLKPVDTDENRRICFVFQLELFYRAIQYRCRLT
jgi:PIF1-like helicase